MTKDSSPNKNDLAISLFKGIVGAIPVAGPLMEEVLGIIIPNQRLDRLARFVNLLEKKLETMNQDSLKIKFLRPGFVDLFEESLHRAARAISDERLEHIASLVKNGLSEEQANYIHYKHMLLLLSEINDIELMLLQAYNFQWVGEFVEKNIANLRPTLAVFGSPPEVIATELIYKSYDDHLLRLNLLQTAITNAPPRPYLKITPFGKLLLQYIDTVDDGSEN